MVNEAVWRSVARMQGRLQDDVTVLHLPDQVIDVGPEDVRAAVRRAVDGFRMRLTGGCPTSHLAS